MKANENMVTGPPYDDVFRTLLNDCSKLIIPVINEIFSTQFTGDEEVIFSPNEHFINRQDGEEEKRITDSSFRIVGKEEKRFLCECQSTADSSMLVRIFEYAAQVALDEGRITENILKVEIPHSAVLFLRSRAATPDKMGIEITTPGGAVCFAIPVMKVQKYGIEEIFAKDLLFLLPFYIFSHESRLEEYNKDEKKLEDLKKEYKKITDRLDAMQETGRISAYTRKTILEMSRCVVEHLAGKYENVREGVKSVMGGRILEYEAKTILREGMQQGMRQGMQQGMRQGMRQGMQQGMQEGRMEQARETAGNLYSLGLEEETIAKMVNVSVDLVKEWLAGKRAL